MLRLPHHRGLDASAHPAPLAHAGKQPDAHRYLLPTPYRHVLPTPTALPYEHAAAIGHGDDAACDGYRYPGPADSHRDAASGKTGNAMEHGRSHPLPLTPKKEARLSHRASSSITDYRQPLTDYRPSLTAASPGANTNLAPRTESGSSSPLRRCSG
jgi:hypothetical protein